jgi:hypothetical protein
MNDGKEILILHSPVLMTMQSIEGEMIHWANFSVCEKKELNRLREILFSMKLEQ